MERLTRISFNSAGWLRPTGEAATQEQNNTYNSVNGFGHEDWLFRNEWIIDGWRYAFIQGVGKSRKALLKAKKPFNLTLFAVEPDKRRRYVAHIRDAEALDDQQADAAVRLYHETGWFSAMEKEIEAVGGKASALADAKKSADILNVRFRVENVFLLPSNIYAHQGDAILRRNRYQLFKVTSSGSTSSRTTRSGSELPPNVRTLIRKGVSAREVSPEHARMQAQLMQDLRDDNPSARVVREHDYIDVLMETETSLCLYEIKSDLSSSTVLRQSIGQLLEYSHRLHNPEQKEVTLVAVGRTALTPDANKFLQYLRQTLGLSLSYCVVKI